MTQKDRADCLWSCLPRGSALSATAHVGRWGTESGKDSVLSIPPLMLERLPLNNSSVRCTVCSRGILLFLFFFKSYANVSLSDNRVSEFCASFWSELGRWGQSCECWGSLRMETVVGRSPWGVRDSSTAFLTPTLLLYLGSACLYNHSGLVVFLGDENPGRCSCQSLTKFKHPLQPWDAFCVSGELKVGRGISTCYFPGHQARDVIFL